MKNIFVVLQVLQDQECAAPQLEVRVQHCLHSGGLNMCKAELSNKHVLCLPILSCWFGGFKFYSGLIVLNGYFMGADGFLQ